MASAMSASLALVGRDVYLLQCLDQECQKRVVYGCIGPILVLYWQYSYARFGLVRSCQYPIWGQYWTSITLLLFAHGPVLSQYWQNGIWPEYYQYETTIHKLV